MSGYAKDTRVSVDRSIAEIRQTLQRFGANGFGYMEAENTATVVFAKEQRHIRFTLPLPLRAQFVYTDQRRIQRSESAIQQAWQQAIAERWRALALAIKAKVVSVDSGIESFEQAFLAHIVDPESGRTVSEIMAPQLADAYAGQPRPLMLKAPESINP